MIDYRPQTVITILVLPLALGCGLWAMSCFLSPNAWADMASVEKLFLEGRYEQTVSVADKLIDRGARGKDELYYLKGLSQLKLKRFEDARQSFERLLSKYPRSKRIFGANVGIGDSYLLESNPDKAIKIYDDILSRFPNDKNVGVLYDRLAYSYKKIGNEARAEEYSAKLNAASPLSFEASSNEGPSRRSSPARAREPVSNFTARKAVSGVSVGNNCVQIGCFKNKKNAEKLRKKLKKEGYDNYIELSGASDDKLYRVKVGRFTTQEEAQSLANRLKRDGYSTKICP